MRILCGKHEIIHNISIHPVLPCTNPPRKQAPYVMFHVSILNFEHFSERVVIQQKLNEQVYTIPQQLSLISEH